MIYLSYLERAAHAADELIAQEGCREPDRLCRALGIRIYEREDFRKLRGMYALVDGQPCVFIKADLEERMKTLILAHELGHHVLHADLMGQLRVLQDVSLWDAASRPELEANYFAAELLIDDDFVLSFAHEGYSSGQMAAALGYPEELLRMKAGILRERGAELALTDPVCSNFLSR